MESARETFEQAVATIFEYWQGKQTLGPNQAAYQNVAALQQAIDLSLPEQGVPLAALIPDIEAYLRNSTKTYSPQFFNQLWGGTEMTGVLAEMVTSAANTSMYTYEVAPVATLLERTLIDRLNQLVGFEAGEGIMVTGSSNANMIALLCARHRCLPDAKQDGLTAQTQPLAAFVSEQAHYSFLKAANLLGLGTKQVIKVPADEDDRMDAAQLEQAIAASLERGERPFFVGATAGTTVAGAFDPLPAIAAVSQKYGLWLHVDGAWGGPVLFSPKYRHLLAGSHLADSFGWDAHKLLGVPLICSAILVKQPGTLLSACSSEDTHYIFHDDDDSAYNLGPMSLQCGRKVDALKFWLSWKHYGTQGYAARVERLFELARYACDRVRSHPDLELVNDPQFLNICFRYRPCDRTRSEPELDRLNLAIRDRLMLTGQAFVNYACYRNRLTIRLVLANPKVEEADLDRFFQSVLAAALEEGGD